MLRVIWWCAESRDLLTLGEGMKSLCDKSLFDWRFAHVESVEKAKKIRRVGRF